MGPTCAGEHVYGFSAVAALLHCGEGRLVANHVVKALLHSMNLTKQPTTIRFVDSLAEGTGLTTTLSSELPNQARGI